MPTNIGTAFFNVTFNTAAARREVTAFVSHANRSFGLLGGAAIVGTTALIAGLVRTTFEIGEAALQASIDYEQAFASVRKTVDDGTLSATDATETFARLNDELRGLALEVPLDLNEDIANVAALGGQLGIATEDLVEFTRIIGELGVTTNVSVEDAATSFARLANIMGLTDKDFRALGDTLVNLGNKLPAQEDEILRFGNRIAAAGELAGFTADEVLAVAAAMSSVGVPAERGGTAIQRTWISIIKAISEGGEALDLIAKVSGTTAEQFARDWEQDASSAFTRFIEGLGASGDQIFTIFRDLGLNDQRVIQSLASIANAGGLLGETFAIAADDLGALSTESEIFFNTTQGQLILFKNTVNDVAISIGDRLNEPFRDIISNVQEWITENPELIDQLADGLVGALETLGGLIEENLPLLEDMVVVLPAIADEVLQAVGPIFDLVRGFVELLAILIKIRDFLPNLFASAETGGVNVGELPFMNLFEVIGEFAQKGPEFFDQVAVAAGAVNREFEELSGFEKFLAIFPVTGVPIQLFGALGDEARGQLITVGNELDRQLSRGADRVTSTAAAISDLDKELEGMGQDLSEVGFESLVQRAGLDPDEIQEVIDLLRELGVEIPLGVINVGDFPAGHPRGGRPAAIPPGFGPDFRRAQDLLAEERALEDADAALKAYNDSFADLRSAIANTGIPASAFLANVQRLNPELVEFVETTGAAELETSLFAAAMNDLAIATDLLPATAGQFGLGDIVEGITEATRQIKDADGEIEEIAVHGSHVADTIIANLNKIAEFEAFLTILAAQGFELLAVELAKKGPEFVHVAEDFVSGAADASVVNAALESGGKVSAELEQKVKDAIANGDVSPEAIQLISTFGSNQVTAAAFLEGQAVGVATGEGFRAGFSSVITGILAGILLGEDAGIFGGAGGSTSGSGRVSNPVVPGLLPGEGAAKPNVTVNIATPTVPTTDVVRTTQIISSLI